MYVVCEVQRTGVAGINGEVWVPSLQVRHRETWVTGEEGLATRPNWDKVEAVAVIGMHIVRVRLEGRFNRDASWDVAGYRNIRAGDGRAELAGVSRRRGWERRLLRIPSSSPTYYRRWGRPRGSIG